MRPMKLFSLLCLGLLLSGCQQESPASSGTASGQETSAAVETVTPKEVVQEGMTPVHADALQNGSYPVTVDASSSMFHVTACTLTVADGSMTAVMEMSGTGYLKVFMGTAEEAAAAAETDCIPCEETPEGVCTFRIPVEALDAGIPCAAYSKRKEQWYDRTILLRADSLPADAFRAQQDTVTAASLGLSDGEYKVGVTLKGGSGRASVQSPAKLTIRDGNAEAELIWSSNSYDYMVVDGKRYEPERMDPVSVFVIPVSAFGTEIAVKADTTAMSTPYEIAYTLYFDPGSITQ